MHACGKAGSAALLLVQVGQGRVERVVCLGVKILGARIVGSAWVSEVQAGHFLKMDCALCCSQKVCTCARMTLAYVNCLCWCCMQSLHLLLLQEARGCSFLPAIA